jgi:RNA polymerase sigma-70 factor, ECF subfamily
LPFLFFGAKIRNKFVALLYLYMSGSFLGHYSAYKDKIYNYFWYRLNFNRELAEDMTSEVFLKAFDKYHTYDQTRPFQSWIYAIAHNHLLNHYRVAGRETPLLPDQHDRGDDSVRLLDISLELEKAIAKIRCMDKTYGEVLLLRFADGLDNREIAEFLGLEEGAVRTRVSRGMKMLKKLL